MRFILTLALLSVFSISCRINSNSSGVDVKSFSSVTAQTETKPVPRGAGDDSADDPAIWVNHQKPDSSRIIGTDKKGGLAVYDLEGKQIFYYTTGKVNNADIRYSFPLAGDTVDILAVNNRTDQTVNIYKINKNGSLYIIHKEPLKCEMTAEVYGLCMFHSATNGRFYVFINSKNGEVMQWELYADQNKIVGKIVRRLKLGTQVEGMVADDETGFLYVGEEDTGIWRFDADPAAPVQGILLDQSSESNNKNIKFDIEGLAIYNLSDSSGYLIASSQGNNTYAVFDRTPPNNYIGSFKVTTGTVCDGSEGTDGIDITNISLGPGFPNGLMVIQDGHNEDFGITVPQNFKYVRWDSIAKKTGLALTR